MMKRAFFLPPHSWGWGEQGRLGHGDEEGRLKPTLVETLAMDVSAVACGGGHTLFVSQDGELAGTGWNEYGQVRGSAGCTVG